MHICKQREKSLTRNTLVSCFSWPGAADLPVVWKAIRSLSFNYFEEMCSWELHYLAMTWVQGSNMHGVEMADLFLSLANLER